MVDMCGRECAGNSKHFLEFRGTGTCKRNGTVEFRYLTVRYRAIRYGTVIRRGVGGTLWAKLTRIVLYCNDAVPHGTGTVRSRTAWSGRSAEKKGMVVVRKSYYCQVIRQVKW